MVTYVYDGVGEQSLLAYDDDNRKHTVTEADGSVVTYGYGTITENDRDEQRKVIKYNHLVANCVIFHNVFTLSQVLHDLQSDGYPLEAEEVAALSPYLMQHINRFGRYDLDMEKRPPELVYDHGI